MFRVRGAATSCIAYRGVTRSATRHVPLRQASTKASDYKSQEQRNSNATSSTPKESSKGTYSAPDEAFHRGYEGRKNKQESFNGSSPTTSSRDNYKDESSRSARRFGSNEAAEDRQRQSKPFTPSPKYRNDRDDGKHRACRTSAKKSYEKSTSPRTAERGEKSPQPLRSTKHEEKRESARDLLSQKGKKRSMKGFLMKGMRSELYAKPENPYKKKFSVSGEEDHEEGNWKQSQRVRPSFDDVDVQNDQLTIRSREQGNNEKDKLTIPNSEQEIIKKHTIPNSEQETIKKSETWIGITIPNHESTAFSKHENALARMLKARELGQEVEDKLPEEEVVVNPSHNFNPRPSTISPHFDPNSPHFISVYAGEASLRPQDDLPMLDSDPNYKSFFDQSAEFYENDRWYIGVVIDADQLLFLPELIKLGEKGAKVALRRIQSNIGREIGRDLPLERLRINCFSNILGLSGYIYGSGVATPKDFQAFLTGLAQESPLTIFADGGSNFQAADVKVKAHLFNSVHDDSCLMVYLGGLGDHGYKGELDSLRRRKMLGKVRLLNMPKYFSASRFYQEYLNRKVEWGNQIFTTNNDLEEQGKLVIRKKGEKLKYISAN